MQHPLTKIAHEPLAPLVSIGKDRSISGGLTEEQLNEYPWYKVTRLELGTLLSENKVPTVTDKGEIEVSAADSKIIFVKDMAMGSFRGEVMAALHTELSKEEYLFPPGATYKVPKSEDQIPKNPTIFPVSLLRKFTHTFLMRDPKVGF